MMKTEKIDSLIERAKAADLEGLDFLYSFDRATLCREYNGIGPEWAGAPIRAKVTRYLTLFEPAALIHDMRNYRSDGTRHGFNFANLEFLENCLKLADDAYPWYSWRRYRARAVAHMLFNFVRGPGGWMAWADCNARNLSRKCG